MTDEQIALAKRAVACKGWRFMGGMLVADAIGKQRVYDDVAGEPYWSADGWLPDLTDPATVGCLLALVREAWGDDEAYAIPWNDEDGGWTLCVGEEDRSVNVSEGDTEAEALVFALEDAP
jgi:hypothetical protein